MPLRIAFISPTGYGNLGDAAIIESLIHGVRQRSRDAEIVGFTLKPYDTAARHGVRAFTCSGVSIPRYRIEERPPGPSDREAKDPNVAALSVAARAVFGTLPGVRRMYRLGRVLVGEYRHRRVSVERIRGFDLVIVAGGGQLDDFWGGPFGHPYTLRRWAALAHAAGSRFVVLSVGTGTLSPLSAAFVRGALASAEYRSYRDARSRELIGDPALTRADPVVPDLAYALPVAQNAVTPALRPTVAVSPMAYADPRIWPMPDETRYRRHVESVVAIAVRLVRTGHDVVLVGTDGPDQKTVADVRRRVETGLEPSQRAHLRAPPVQSVRELMEIFAGVEVVVAARLHGIVLAQVAGRPVLAISHERKVRTAMEDAGLARYCFEIDGFDVESGWERLMELRARRAELSEMIRHTVAEYRHRVEEQYDRVLGRSDERRQRCVPS